MSTPRGPHGDEPSSGGSGLPPHLDPRGRKGPPPRVTNAYRQAARGGPAPTVLGPSTTTLPGPAPKGRRTGGQRALNSRCSVILSASLPGS